MRCPILADLPPSPPGRSGWPWTVETPQLPPARPDGSPWPRISIVTPSFSQGQFIEETIRSILLQGYPDVEYIIIDGGSTDQSVEIIKKYEVWLSYWVSEKDRGQAHAINKGLAKASGEIFQFINSDDVLLKEAFLQVASAFTGNAVATAVLAGWSLADSIKIQNESLTVSDLLNGKQAFAQPGLWFPRNKLVLMGFDQRLHYAFDWDLTIRYLDKFPQVDYIRNSIAFFRHHADSKTIMSQHCFTREHLLIKAQWAQVLTNPMNRDICRRFLRCQSWQRHLTQLRARSRGRRVDVAIRMILLALRRPRERINRYWFGALRRTLLS
jgi:glycosyltransferase involved in cell wall biosynthesis